MEIPNNEHCQINWNSIFSQQAFWRSYFDDEEYNLEVIAIWLKELGLFKPYDPESEDIDDSELPESIFLTIRMQKGFCFEWEFFPEYGAAVYNLYLIHPQLGRVKIGWNDHCYHLDTFRWEEFNQIIKIAKEHWQSPSHFYYFPALLLIFIGNTPQDNRPEIIAQLKECFLATNAYNEEESEELAQLKLSVPNDYSWERDMEKGWVFSGGHSTRDKKDHDEKVFVAIRDFFHTLA